ncbi:MAG TPA: hypothetical protein VKH37_10645, partial [Ferruginibacter sp.]|nr:hypothetical protein [Ferruginibacter sp.]
MRLIVTLFFTCISLFSFAQRVELPTAKFMTGDDVTYSYPVTDDQQWHTIQTNQNWEKQGYPDYDGFAWYRFHLIIPVAYKTNSFLKDSVRIYLTKVDDAFELYLNGMRIGKSGSFPDDKQGYTTTWNKRQEFHIPADFPTLNWGGENILSVRVYDGGGAGGIFGGIPYVSMIDLVDAVTLDDSAPLQILTGGKAKKNIVLIDTFNTKVSGKLRTIVFNIDKATSDTNIMTVNLLP